MAIRFGTSSILALILAACSSDGAQRGSLGEPEPGDGGGVDSGGSKIQWGPGAQLDLGLSWPGYAEGKTTAGTIHLSDFSDPDGSKGINALIITEENMACDACLQETADIPGKLPGYTADGVHVLQLVIYDGTSGAPATIASALEWKTHFAASWGVGSDPNFTFAEAGSNPLPTQLLVDPRTLQVFDRSSGYRKYWTSIDQLVAKNKH